MNIMHSRRHLANAIRALSMDAVQQAQSGHPGMPMGMADIAEVLWNDFLKHSPVNPQWPNRDRFILSNGHGSMLQYALLHLSGYDLSIDDLKHFRQLHSKTPGHPEYGFTPGVETTTGPLGQGLANAVGMAIAEKLLAEQFNRDGYPIIDHNTYVLMGDGCLMEGISHEVCSLAGTLGLGKLIAFWDDNEISIDGKVGNWFSDDTALRFEAYGWHVVAGVDGHDAAVIKAAIISAGAVTDKPSIICCKTTIGYGASANLAGTAAVHGAPLGAEEILEVRKNIGWASPAFEIPGDVYAGWDAKSRGAQWEAEWQKKFAAYQRQYPELAEELLRRLSGELPKDWVERSAQFIHQASQQNKPIATRKASLACLNHYGPHLPELLGGSADLSHSNLTFWSGSVPIIRDHFKGNYLHYGVREFGMFAIMNGISLHGGFIPYGGTFLTFIDYGRNAIRLAAMMKQRVIFTLTHDSIGLGEDGPTHQPIEQAAILRMTPGLSVWRPCDNTETAIAWQAAISNAEQPTCLLLSRQNLPEQIRDQQTITNIQRGAYILINTKGVPDAIIIATGSEVQLAVTAAQKLAEKKYTVRVISMPSADVFEQQALSYREQILPPNLKNRVAVEAGQPDFWFKYVGLEGQVIGINRYGESAPADEVYTALGITVDNVIAAVLKLIQQGASE